MGAEESGEINDLYEDDISLDSNVGIPLLWMKSSRNQINALSQGEDKAGNDKATIEWKDKAALDGRATVICDEAIADLHLMMKVVFLHDPEADLFDVFDTIRTKFLGGWGYTPEFLAKLDAEIESDYQRGKM